MIHADDIKLKIISRLRAEIIEKEFELYYQPILNLKTRTCIGIEALLRWRHSELGMLRPSKFLLYVKEVGVLDEITRWVFRRALTDYRKLALKSLFVSVNLSVDELNSACVVDIILNAQKELDFQPGQLVVELTEETIMKHPKISVQKLEQLAAAGIQVAVDDYGVGFSSLSYLKRLPVTMLKIDRSYIKDIEKDRADAIIVKSTIQLAHSLGIKVVAEGIETGEQFQFLRENACDYGQGYYFSKPKSLENLHLHCKDERK